MSQKAAAMAERQLWEDTKKDLENSKRISDAASNWEECVLFEKLAKAKDQAKDQASLSGSGGSGDSSATLTSTAEAELQDFRNARQMEGSVHNVDIEVVEEKIAGVETNHQASILDDGDGAMTSWTTDSRREATPNNLDLLPTSSFDEDETGCVAEGEDQASLRGSGISGDSSLTAKVRAEAGAELQSRETGKTIEGIELEVNAVLSEDEIASAEASIPDDGDGAMTSWTTDSRREATPNNLDSLTTNSLDEASILDDGDGAKISWAPDCRREATPDNRDLPPTSSFDEVAATDCGGGAGTSPPPTGAPSSGAEDQYRGPTGDQPDRARTLLGEDRALAYVEATRKAWKIRKEIAHDLHVRNTFIHEEDHVDEGELPSQPEARPNGKKRHKKTQLEEEDVQLQPGDAGMALRACESLYGEEVQPRLPYLLREISKAMKPKAPRWSNAKLKAACKEARLEVKGKPNEHYARIPDLTTSRTSGASTTSRPRRRSGG